MSTPNPLLPQGVLPDKGKSHVRIAVFTILAIHVVLLSGLLILGCKKTEEPPPSDLSSVTNLFPPLAPPEVLPEPTSAPSLTEHPAIVPPTDTQAFVAPPPVVVTPPIPPPVESMAAGTEHVVIKGESFYSLAKKYGVTMRAIAEANPGVDSTRLTIGQKLQIPPQTQPSSGAANIATTSDGMKIYTVKSGDNLTKIARAHGVTLRVLRSANSLKTDQLKVGQKLKIPVKNGSPAETIPPGPEATIPQPGPSTPGVPASPGPDNP
jgi:LysM repeat protein